MKFIIPYKSKIKNPNAENTIYLIPGKPTVEIVSNKDLNKDNDDNLILISMLDEIYTYVVRRPEELDLNKYKNYFLEIRTSFPIKEFHSLVPEGEWIYKYDNYEVECESCGAIFDWKELKDWTDGDEYYYRESDTICPKCGEWDCCEIEFQE